MRLDFNKEELDLVVGALLKAASETKRSAGNAVREGYSQELAEEMHRTAKNQFDLADRLTEARRQFSEKPAGSTGTVDPYDMGYSKPFNDPIGWK